MTTIIKWELNCVTDDKLEHWFLEDGSPKPTTCPTDSSHEISAESIVIVDEISQNLVTVREESKPTGGKWEAEAFFLEGTTGPSETSRDFSWDNPISVLDMQFTPTDENYKDAIKLSIIPPNTGYGEGVIGVLAATAPTGASGIHVGQTIIENVKIADNLSLRQGVTDHDLGNVISIDAENGIIYCKNPVLEEFNVASPTFVKFERRVLERFLIGPPQRYPLGDSKIGGSYIPKDYIVRVTYVNNGGAEKEMYCIIEYLE